MRGLGAAKIVERNILLALKAAIRIPIGLAVTDVVDGRHVWEAFQVR